MIHFLFRFIDEDVKAEAQVANMFFPVHTIRETIPAGSLVIPRYSLLPYPDEVIKGLDHNNSKTINSLAEHLYIAGFWEWYEALTDHGVPTPESWSEDAFPRCTDSGPFVVKGATNSKKWLWRTHMYAEDKQKAIEVGNLLRRDSMIGEQPIIYRKYVPLKTAEVGLNDVPFAYEWRFFFFGQEMLASSYYWSPAEEMIPVPDEAAEVAQAAAEALVEDANITFFVVDVAVTEEGEYIVIEVNDGQQSGLSEIEPITLYDRLRKALQVHYPEHF